MFITKAKQVKLLNIIYDILEEFYTEGTDVYLSESTNMQVQYIWLPVPNYPTYIPCFKSRDIVSKLGSPNHTEVYICSDGSVIPNALVCGGTNDCGDSEDEKLVQCALMP